MTSNEDRQHARCPLCDLRMAETQRVVSRHSTSSGTVVYARCDCGRLSVWLVRASAETIL